MPRTRPWVRIAEDLRNAINARDLPPGQPLPTARELMDRWGVARQTVQNAVDQLLAEGLVTSRPGRGWFVAEQRPARRVARTRLSRAERAAGRGAFLTDAEDGGFQPEVTVEVSRENADDRVAELLGLTEARVVVVRDRVMRADGAVVQLATSYLPASLASGTAIELPDPGPGGIYARLEELGHPLTHFEESVRGRPPLPSEASDLSIPYGYPVLSLTRIAWSGERPVEVNDIVVAADRFEFVYSWPAD